MGMRKKNLDQAAIQVLIRPYKGHYIAMCPEMGLYFEGQREEVQKELFSCMSLTLRAVEKDASLLPSLFVGVDLNYAIFFYWSIFLYQIRRFMDGMQKFLVLQGNASSIGGLVAACG